MSVRSAGGRAFSMTAEVEIEIVGRNREGKEVREDADGIVFPEDEVAEQKEAPGDAHVPEDTGKNRAAGLPGSVDLDEPAPGEEDHAEIADEFPGSDPGAEEFEEDIVHFG